MLGVNRVKLPIQTLVKEILDQLPTHVWTQPDVTFMDPAMGGGQFILEIERRLKVAGHSDESIAARVWGCEERLIRVKYVQNWHKAISQNLHVMDFLAHDWGNMKFDVIVGNPPYGKNSSLAVEFLNKSGDLAKQVCFVLPRTFRKSSILNRVNTQLHQTLDQTVPDHMFPAPILTCYQMWHKTEQLREKIETVTTHADFEFVTPDQANVCIGRVGAGPCGNIYMDRFDERSVNSHYFIKTKNKKVLQKLHTLSVQFRQAGNQTVGVPSLSKDELIKIYEGTLNV